MSRVWFVATRPQATTTAALPARAARYTHTHTKSFWHSRFITLIISAIKPDMRPLRSDASTNSYRTHPQAHTLWSSLFKVNTQQGQRHIVYSHRKMIHKHIYMKTCQSVTSALTSSSCLPRCHSGSVHVCFQWHVIAEGLECDSKHWCSWRMIDLMTS